MENKTARRIPVMIEAKGLKNRLEKISKSGQIELITYYEKDSKRKDGTIQHHAGDANYSSIMNYAVNGAVHYANAILDSRGYTEVIAIGINGTQMNADGSVQDAECRAYYISEKNNRVPKHIPELDKEWSLLKADNLDRFFAMLDKMTLTEKELEDLRQRTETALETKIKSIHQSLYDDPKLRTALTTNEKLYLFCGLIMVGLTTKGVAPLDVNQFTGNDDQEDNDSTIIITRIRSFLKKKKCGDDKIRMILDLLQPVFKKETLWRPVNGESILKSLFKQVKQDIIPCLESNLHLDFTGKILNSLGDWVHIENDRENDVVLTPRYVTTLMAKLARTNMDSFVWDRAMGSAGFLVSAMDIMIKDAQAKIHDQKELEKKITNIKEHQLLGVEILGNIYILAVLNMILMGDGSSNIYNGDGHDYNNETGKFPATVFLLNPPYSADGKGFNFVQEALEKMTSGYACVLIQENAGSGNGLPYTKKILEKNTLCASVHMSDIFCGKSSVQTAMQERISVLEQYLLAAGLDDYKLTTEDQETLNKKATVKPFRIGDLFVSLKGGYIGTGKKIGSATKARSEEYCIPLTCAKLGDNGIMYWGKKGDFRTYTNAISIIADGAVSAGLVYAQPEEAGVYSHSYFIRLENVEVSYRTNLYLASVLNKVLYPKYSRERPPRWENKVENDSILLPVTAEGQPDYSYMEQYIRVQEKLAIRDAIQLKDRIIEETKCVVGA